MPMAGLVRASAHARKIGTETGFLHTTQIEGGGPNMQSVVANNDLDEMLSLADLANKDYTAEREHVTVVVCVPLAPPCSPALRPPVGRPETRLEEPCTLSRARDVFSRGCGGGPCVRVLEARPDGTCNRTRRPAHDAS
jgi:hypothetical protein